jgi:transcriptional regulator
MSMYVPPHFEETRVGVLHQLMRERPFAILVTLGSGGLNANHIPFELDPKPAPFGTLRGHVARANPVWRDVSPTVESLAIFNGPQTYVTPSWYVSKNETGEVVPTYNYVVVHAHGGIKIVDDRDWLRGLVTRLTHRFEADRNPPWSPADAPAAFIDKQLGAIVGIELAVTKLIGKWKVSQNRPAKDRDGVARALSDSTAADDVAMAQWIREKSPSQ